MHAAQTEMVDDAACDTETRARMGELDLDAQAGVAIPGLPFDVAVSLVEKTTCPIPRTSRCFAR